MLMFTIFGALLIVPGNILNSKYGIHASIKIGCLLTLVGSFFTFFIYLNFWFFFIGHLLNIIGISFRLIAAS